MYSIKVKFRPPTTDVDEGTIYYQITHERIVRRYATKYHVLPNEWDYHHSSVSSKRSDRKHLILSVRKSINRDMELLNKITKRLEGERLSFTADDVIDEFKRYEIEYSLFHYMESLIAKLTAKGKTRTSETYTAALNSFKKFRGNEDIMLDCLSSDIMEEYEAWHRNNGNSQNTISFYMRILRAVYNKAVEDDIIANRNPFRRVYTGIDKTIRRALPLAIIKEIKALELPKLSPIDFARDMFMMSFYLRGMSFIDMAFLRKSDLKNGVVVYRRHKTGQQLTIAWTSEMQTIIDKYPVNPTKYLLPIIKNEGINERCAYRNMNYNINHNLKQVAKLMDLKITLTMYVARHSWATAAKSKGIPLIVISEGLGHDSEATTRIYLASLETSVVDKANELILASL